MDDEKMFWLMSFVFIFCGILIFINQNIVDKQKNQITIDQGIVEKIRSIDIAMMGEKAKY